VAAKWSKTFFADLGERVGATLIGAVITMLTADSSGVVSGSARQWWLIVGLPTVLALLKGVGANMAQPESGPSLLPAPPAPEVNEAGHGDLYAIVAVLALALAVAAICGVRLG
jgi:hypothetical protein